MTLFEKIATGQIPARIIEKNDDWFAFHDIHPQAPVHVLVVPTKPIQRVGAASSEDALILGKLLLGAGKVARQLGISETGFRVVINNGPDGGETVPHLHVHVLGGRSLVWPPG
jgi:histidine triad (HIT) family protein